MTLMRVVFALLLAAVNGCNCSSAARPCSSSSDCLAGEICLADGNGDLFCRTAGEGEGEGGEGEGEGEGAEGEGEGAEGEGEGGSVCGDSAITGGEQCDDGNADDKDLCSNACTLTAVTTSVLFGVQPLAALPILQPGAVWGAPDRGLAVAQKTGEIYIALRGSDRFVRVDDSVPFSRANPGAAKRIIAVAMGPANEVYDVDGARGGLVHRIDPIAGDDVVYAGNGHTTDDVVDPPSFVFSGGPTSVELDTVALDVDALGTLYTLGNNRVIAVDADGTTHVVAGSFQPQSTGTPAQRTQFTNLHDISVDNAGGTAPVALWLAGAVAGVNEVFRVTLSDGSVEALAGSGTACEGPIAGCALAPAGLSSDGADGVFVVVSGAAGGVFHVDGTAQHVVHQVAPASSVGNALDAACIAAAPAQLALVQQNDARIEVVSDGGSVLAVGPPLPAFGKDVSLAPIRAAAASDTAIFWATTADLWSVDESGAVVHLAGVADLGPCGVGVVNVADGLTARADGSAVYLAQSGQGRICKLDLVSNDVTVVAGSLTSVAQIGLRSGDILAATTAGIVRVPLDGSATSTLIPSPLTVVALATSSDDHAQVLKSDGSRAFIAPGPANTVTTAGVSGVGVAGGLVFAFGGGPTDSTVYFAADNEVIGIDGTGTPTSVLAGGTGVAGFVDGGGGAKFDATVFALVQLADGAIGVVGADSIRFIVNGTQTVSTLVGSDQHEEDGSFTTTARMASPSSIACIAHRCIAADTATRTLRAIDFDTERVDNAFGNEAAPIAGLAAATLLDANTAVFSDGAVLHVVDLPSGVASTFAQGGFVGTPTFVAPAGGGDVVFYDGAHLKVGPNSPLDLGAVPGPVHGITVDAGRHFVGFISDDAFDFRALDGSGSTGQPFPLGGALGAGRAIAVDDDGNIFVSTSTEIFEVLGDGTPRTMISVGDPLLPFASGILAVEGGDILAGDPATGALLHIAIH